MKTGVLVTLLALAVSACVGSAPATRGGSQAISLWGRWERAFEALGPPSSLEFFVTLTSPTGEMREVRGFWDGGNTWRVRFMPDEEGLWRYETHARPYVAGLAGQRGTFVCYGRRSPDNPLYRHGPIAVSASGPFLAHRDGTPFFWMADTAWNGALRSRYADWQTYLDTRREQRFSAVQFVTTQWRAAETDREGQRAYSGYESITINPAFFQRLDSRIDAVNEAGLLAVPVLLWGLGGDRAVPGRLPESEAIKLARYVTARYGAHHVAWILGGDADYGGEHAERWKRIGRAVFGPGVDAPVFLHPQGMQWPWDAFRDESWLTALGYQSGHGDDDDALSWIHSGPAAETWQEFPGSPIINLEPPYEGIVAYQSGVPHSAYNVRRAAYWSLLSTPIAGVSYGAHGVWSWEAEAAIPLNHDGSGRALPWFQALEFPGGEDMSHVVDLFDGLSWWRLRPDPELVEQEFNDPAGRLAASRAPDGLTAVVYLPRGGEIVLDGTRLSTGAVASWFNPRDGRRSTASPVGQSRYEAPDAQDWVLVFTPRPDPDEG